jgi:hypothetical protein
MKFKKGGGGNKYNFRTNIRIYTPVLFRTNNFIENSTFCIFLCALFSSRQQRIFIFLFFGVVKSVLT